MENPEQNLELDKEIVIDEGKVTLSEEKFNKLVKSQADLTQTKSNLVSEIQELREKKQLTEDEKAELITKVTELEAGKSEEKIETEDVKTVAEEVVNKIFSKREAESREDSMRKAMESFMKSNPEFSSENDEGGLKKSAFEKKLVIFNTDNCKSQEDFLSVFNDTNRLLGGTVKSVEDVNNNIPAAIGETGKPKEVEIHELDPKELKVINRFMEGDKEKYLKIKSKRPDYVASLFQYIY